MNDLTRTLFIALLAIILLCAYAFSVFDMIYTVVTNCTDDGTGCKSEVAAKIGKAVIKLAENVGALVWTLVAAQLAVAQVGHLPTLGNYVPATPTAADIKKILVLAYLAVWLVTGLSALYTGTFLYPEAFEPLTKIGQQWTSSAIVAVAAYFGIKAPPFRSGRANS